MLRYAFYLLAVLSFTHDSGFPFKLHWLSNHLRSSRKSTPDGVDKGKNRRAAISYSWSVTVILTCASWYGRLVIFRGSITFLIFVYLYTINSCDGYDKYEVWLTSFQIMESSNSVMEDVALQESGEKEGYHEKEKIGGDVKNVKDLFLRESRCQITLVGFEEEQLGY